MEQDYNHKEVESRICQMWEKGNYFTPKIDKSKKPFSMFLAPPNASGGMHIGNMFMIAIQDILARYHRAKGEPTLWIPGTDHGGYETQVTFERELEKIGKSRYEYRNRDLFNEIKKFVEENNRLIEKQIKAMGASVDWSRFRFTMDDQAIKSVLGTFKKMVSDSLIYRNFYMVNYCSSCGTVLADIELTDKKENLPLYHIKFKVLDSEEFLSVATTRPEFLFAVTHILINPLDKRYAHHIGKILRNPITGEKAEVIEEKRKFDPAECDPFISPFAPSYKSYDYGYALRHSLPARNLLNWDGNMIERYSGMKPVEARDKEVAFLKEIGAIEKIDESHTDSVFFCKRGHEVGSMVMLSWFLKLDDEKNPLRKPTVDVLKAGGLNILPKWREKGLVQWMEKMHDWPIARQNVWGIKIPVWYDISEPSKFVIWFVSRSGEKCFGNLKTFLDKGISLEELSEGLERIYGMEDAPWVLDREVGKNYLPETDTFDTWFSSGQWGTIVFGDPGSPDFSYFYPSEVVITGHDLIRLFVSRMVLLSQYVTRKLPFKYIYLHRLILGQDGQKMSKSLGNSVTPEYYLDNYGVDVTRMAMISCTSLPDDFVLTDDRLLFYNKFSQRLWEMKGLVVLANEYAPEFSESLDLSNSDIKILGDFGKLVSSVSFNIERYSFSTAQEKLCSFFYDLENFAHTIKNRSNIHISLSVLRHVYRNYLIVLHPFVPFMTEELFTKLYNPPSPLAISSWPTIKPNKKGGMV